MNSKKSNASNETITEQISAIEELSTIGFFRLNVRVRTAKARDISERMKFLADVTIGYVHEKSNEVVFTIRGLLKEFTDSKNVQLDFSNSRDNRYPNAKLGDSILHYISFKTVSVIYDRLVADNKGGATQSFKIVDGKIQRVKETIGGISDAESIALADAFLEEASTYEMRERSKEKKSDKKPAESEATDADAQAALDVLNEQ